MTNNFNPAWYEYTAYNTDKLIAWFDTQDDALAYLEYLNTNYNRSYNMTELDNVSDVDDAKFQQLCVMTSETIETIKD
jgi:hypothetical protein